MHEDKYLDLPITLGSLLMLNQMDGLGAEHDVRDADADAGPLSRVEAGLHSQARGRGRTGCMEAVEHLLRPAAQHVEASRLRAQRRGAPHPGEAPELRIVPDALWQAVKARQASLARGSKPKAELASAVPFFGQQRPKYLRTGKMLCGECGSS